MKDNKLNPPAPFCFNPKRVQAIILGADPSNISNEGKRKVLTTVFGICDNDARYFKGILSNLNSIGLHLEDVYVDNVINEYLPEETGKNQNWEETAKEHLPLLKKRLSKINKNVPVLVTAERIYKFLWDGKAQKADEIYSNPAKLSNGTNNLLGRVLIPFYRHTKYSLNKRGEYRLYLFDLFSQK